MCFIGTLATLEVMAKTSSSKITKCLTLELDGPEMKNLIDAEKTGAFRCGTFNASDQRQIALGDFVGKMSIIDLENHSKVFN